MKFSKLFGKFFVALVVPSLMISSCALLGLEEEEEETETASSASIPELAGTWSSTCEDMGNGLSLNMSVTHSESKLDFDVIFYLDSTCSSEFFTNTESSKSIEKGSAGTLSDGTSGNLLKGVLQTATRTPATAAAAAQMNSDPSNNCGISSYSAGVATDISGTDCMGTEVGEAISIPYSVAGTSLKLDFEPVVTFTKQ